MKETIAEMLKVEAQAKAIVAAAEKDAIQIVQNARLKAASIQEAAHHSAQAAASQYVEDGLRQARERREQVLAQIGAKAEGLRRVAHETAETASNIVRAALTG